MSRSRKAAGRPRGAADKAREQGVYDIEADERRGREAVGDSTGAGTEHSTDPAADHSPGHSTDSGPAERAPDGHRLDDHRAEGAASAAGGEGGPEPVPATAAPGAGAPETAPEPPLARTELISEGVGDAPVPMRPPVRHVLHGVDLTVELGADVTVPNPVMTASGCAANGRELHRFFDVADLGAVTTKTVMTAPRSGRGTPRMAETPSGMLNSIGLQGPGIEAFVEGDLAWLKSVGARVLVSVAGNDAREFADVTRVLRNSAAFDACVGVEVNISCPNVANRGLVFACDPASTAQVMEQVRTELPPDIPAFAKLSPDVTDIVAIARAALDAGASGLTMINTLLGMSIDTDLLRPTLLGLTGGVSGPAIRPVAVRAVFQVAAAMRAGLLPVAPIIGVGGIATGLDALQFLAAGASAVQVGTATFHDPLAPIRVRDELAAALAARGFTRVTDVVGVAHDRLP